MNKSINKNSKIRIATLIVLISVILSNGMLGQERSLVDFFLPMEPQTELVSHGIWGDTNVLPRDTANGLEDATLKNWCYWDGSIVRDDDGLYHMYASRWTQKVPHSQGWKYNSKAMHAVSEHPIGPYVDLGMIHPAWRDGLGSNVVGIRTHDGKYAVAQSERSSGEIFISDNPYGPFELLGEIKIDCNGYPESLARYDSMNAGAVRDHSVGNMANVQIFYRPDGRYMLVPRSCAIFISDSGILGPYKIMAGPAYTGIEDLPQSKMEDPTIWYSGGMYHIVVNHHAGGDVSYHLTSKDGITNWKNRGVAFKKQERIFKYTDGTENYWRCIQRPTVYVEDGHPILFHFSVVDSGKGGDTGDDNNGSKIIVVPFDGVAFDKYMQDCVMAEESAGK